MNTITIPVSNTAIGTKPDAPVDLRDSVQSLLQRRIEAMELSHARLVSCQDIHPFAQAAHDAFYDHYPLAITPDDIWFCLVQGFSQHVNLNAESLRHRFVAHEGRLKLIVDAPDFELGKPNPWPQMFEAFSGQIADHVGKPLHDTVVCDFSTTTPMHRAASEVALMDMFQAYFEYEMRAGCGIPSIHLKGAPDDWRDIRSRAARFAEYGLEAWVSALLPVLDQHHKDWRERDAFDGPYLNQIPSGVSSAPGKFIDLRSGESHELRFVAGMFGVAQDEQTLELAPSFGWAVVYDQKLPKPERRPGYWAREVE